MNARAVETLAGGRVFISYRRCRKAEIDVLADALRVHGIPTWQDVDDLGPHSTPAQIRAVLADPATSGAVVWITPELEDSDFINEVELPVIVGRAIRGDGFFVQMVAAGGLSQHDAGEIAGRRLGKVNPAYWNIMQVTSDPLELADAAAVVSRVLGLRLRVAEAALPPGAPVRLRLDTRPAAFDAAVPVQMSWSRHFPPGPDMPQVPDERTWREKLSPALQTVASAVAMCCPRREVRATGRLALAAAVALGHAFRDTTGILLTWEQYHEGAWTDWSLAMSPEDSGRRDVPDEREPSSGQLALLVSAIQPVEPAFANSRGLLPVFRGVVHVQCLAAAGGAMTPGQGRDVARRVREELVLARSEWRLRGGHVHLFTAAPAGLAVLIGQQMKTFTPITVYEYVKARNAYVPALTIGTTAS